MLGTVGEVVDREEGGLVGGLGRVKILTSGWSKGWSSGWIFRTRS